MARKPLDKYDEVAADFFEQELSTPIDEVGTKRDAIRRLAAFLRERLEDDDDLDGYGEFGDTGEFELIDVD